MLVRMLVATAALAYASPVFAADSFDKIRCDDDIRAALMGARTPGGPVVATEAKHKAIGLQHLGADEINSRLNSISWRICGREFETLETLETRGGAVRDALEVPAHSKSAPLFQGVGCVAAGKEVKDVVLAILDDPAGKPPGSLAAKVAWKIDAKAVRFVKIDAAGLICPRDGIITADGGM